MRFLLLIPLLAIVLRAEDDNTPVKPPRPPKELADEFDKARDEKAAAEKAEAQKTRAKNMAIINAAIKEGNPGRIEIILNTLVKDRKNSDACEYKCGEVKGKLIVVAKYKGCKTQHEAIINIGVVALDVGELLERNCPINRVEVQIITFDKQVAAVSLPLAECKTLSEEFRADVLTQESYLKFQKKCAMHPIYNLNLPTE